MADKKDIDPKEFKRKFNLLAERLRAIRKVSDEKMRELREDADNFQDALELLRSQLILLKATPASALTKHQREAVKVQKKAVRKAIFENLDGLVEAQLDIMEAQDEPLVDILTLK